MSDALNRAERCRDLAEECRNVAAMCGSTEMGNHYRRMAEHYTMLAEAEDRVIHTPRSVRPRTAGPSPLGAALGSAFAAMTCYAIACGYALANKGTTRGRFRVARSSLDYEHGRL
jgi:hypothetical protein